MYVLDKPTLGISDQDNLGNLKRSSGLYAQPTISNVLEAEAEA
jgi:hypothetical protein